MALRATKVENAGARRPERPPQAECLPHSPAAAVEVVRQEVFEGAPQKLGFLKDANRTGDAGRGGAVGRWFLRMDRTMKHV